MTPLSRVRVEYIGGGGIREQRSGTMRIVILDNVESDAGYQGLGNYCYERMAGFFREGYEVVRMRPPFEGLPEDSARWAEREGVYGLVIGGSLKCPLDTDSWIREEERFVREFAGAGRPVLAICFGHELLASAFGGGLERMPRLKCEAGPMELLKEDALFEGMSGETFQVVNHSVRVVRPPKGFEPLAATPGDPVQAMKMKGAPVYGVQFHPEMDPGIKKYDPSWRTLADQVLEKIEGRLLMDNFKRIVASARV